MDQLMASKTKLVKGALTKATLLPKTGNATLSQLSVSAITVGGKKRLLIAAAILQDIAVDKKELIRSQQQLSEAMRFSKIGTAELTVENYMVDLSEEFLQLVEEDPGAPNKLVFSDFVNKYLIPEDRSLIYEKLQEGLVSNEMLKRVQAEFRINTAKGNRKVFNAQGTFRKNGKVLGVFQDVTARRQTEEEYSLKTRQIQRILYSISDGIFALDRDLNFIMINNVFRSYTNLTEEEVIGKNVTAIFPHAKDTPLYQCFKNALSTGESFSIEYERYKHPGQIFQVSGYPSAEGLFVYYKDITQIKQSHKAQQESQFLYQNLFEHNPLSMWIFDVDTFEFLDVNQAAITLYGYTKDEFLRKTILEIRPPAEMENARRIVRSNENDYSVVEAIHQKKNGEIITVDVHSHVIDYKDRRARIVVVNDITAKRKAERENKKLALVASRTNNAVTFTDCEGRITWVNAGFERLTEYKMEEVLGRKPGELLQGPETNPQTVAHMRSSLKNVKAFRTEVLNYTKSGKKYWLDMDVMPMYDGGNVVTGFMAIQTDITTIKLAMHEMFKSQSQLQTILDHAPMMVYMKDKRGRYLFNNLAFQKTLPVNRKDKARLQELFPKEIADIQYLKDQEIFETGNAVEFPYQIGDKQFHEVKFPIRDDDGNIYAVAGMSLDVTETNKIILQLRESEQRFRDMADHAPVWIWITDENKKDTYFNAIALNYLGLTLEEALNKSWAEFAHPEDAARMIKAFDVAFEKQEAFTIEYRLRRYDGECRWFMDNGSPRHFHTGEFAGFIGTCMDIHERKLGEELLLASENRYRSIVEDQLDLICRIERDGTLTFVNRAYARLFGIAEDEIVGKSFSFLLPERDRQSMITLYDGIFEGRIPPVPVENLVQAGDQTWRWIEWHILPLRDDHGKIYEVQSIGHDITERKKLESEQARLDLIVRESYNEIYLFNHKTLIFEFANASALRNLGYSLAELMKMKFTDLFNYPDEMAIRALIAPLIKRETSRLKLQIKHHRKNGTAYDVDIVIQYQEKEGSIVAIATDITEKLSTEKKLLATIMEKETLIKEIHHRVKNNLQLISSIIYIKMKSLEGEEVRYFLENTRQKIRSIALIHERLLQSETLDKVEISDYLGRLINDIQVTNATPDLALTFKTEIQNNIVDLDSAIYCGLIVNELITNAIKHAFKGMNEGIISVRLNKEQEKFLLVVSDNGVTIPESVTPGESASFGMHLLQIFVRQLGGTLEIIREKGTIFQMRF
jgi:PAS domain S-box-containing protein